MFADRTLAERLEEVGDCLADGLEVEVGAEDLSWNEIAAIMRDVLKPAMMAE